jgi:uncharacterized protein
MIHRTQLENIQNHLFKGKAIILTGPRQSGKTTLFNVLLEQYPHLSLNADDPFIKEILTRPNLEQLKSIINQHKLIFIDEAQRIEDIGITLKMITDNFKDVQLLANGSSSFELSNRLNEPLTGRKFEFKLLPLSWEEFQRHDGYLLSEQHLENQLIYGFYPDVVNNQGNEKFILNNLLNSYLYQDILSFSNLRKPEVLEKLVQALAFQVGNEINLNELSQIVGIDKNTVNKYIDILEKGLVIFKLGSFSRNLRNEIKTNKKVYFYDNGIRNAVISNFSPFGLRNDIGAIWENFLMSERMKYNIYHNKYKKMYFWRTKQQQKIDLIEESDGKIMAYEFKYSPRRQVKFPKIFIEKYNATGQVISRNNFRDFVAK